MGFLDVKQPLFEPFESRREDLGGEFLPVVRKRGGGGGGGRVDEVVDGLREVLSREGGWVGGRRKGGWVGGRKTTYLQLILQQIHLVHLRRVPSNQSILSPQVSPRWVGGLIRGVSVWVGGWEAEEE